jgi:hypothetical protein
MLYDETGIIGMVHTTESGTATSYYFQRNLLGEVEEAEELWPCAP